LNHRDAGQREQAKTNLHERIYYQHAVDNAFFPFKYLGGGGAHGIFGAIPPCFSHTVQEGVFKYVIRAFYKLVTTRVLSEIDYLASQLLCDIVLDKPTVPSFHAALSPMASLAQRK
jgi:hypothetical protein